MGAVSAPEASAPAKINLFLAITGRRADGFHDLVSVAARLSWGDTVSAAAAEGASTVECDDPSVPRDASNLVLKAAAAFAEATGWRGGARFRITKRVPAGAGLGGASSDAVAALRILNGFAGGRLDEAGLADASAAVGSDCPLFLAAGPVVMRGRGESLEQLPAGASRRIRGRRVLVFKPAFPIATAWAYAQLASHAPGAYVGAQDAEATLAGWVSDPRATAEDLLFNSMEAPAFAKFPALPALLGNLGERFGLRARMSGSGSACYALMEEDADAVPVEAAIREAWGPSALVVDTRFA
jgi:4-diphosphocytidyl-2-C-methyl-D-erythritol kinase